jgi:hypothetical protein
VSLRRFCAFVATLDHFTLYIIINIILLSANTNLRFWSRRPHLGNELHTFTHAKLSSYPVTCVCQPSKSSGFYGQSHISHYFPQCFLSPSFKKGYLHPFAEKSGTLPFVRCSSSLTPLFRPMVMPIVGGISELSGAHLSTKKSGTPYPFKHSHTKLKINHN